MPRSELSAEQQTLLAAVPVCPPFPPLVPLRELTRAPPRATTTTTAMEKGVGAPRGFGGETWRVQDPKMGDRQQQPEGAPSFRSLKGCYKDRSTTRTDAPPLSLLL